MDKIVNGAIWMIDTSIALGAGKILAILELKIDHFKNHEGAPTLESINCVAISVARSWTGESVAKGDSYHWKTCCIFERRRIGPHERRQAPE